MMSSDTCRLASVPLQDARSWLRSEVFLEEVQISLSSRCDELPVVWTSFFNSFRSNSGCVFAV